ncbi:MAG TPA: hypothetical protein VN692_19400, partial [Steroidobacteraceae bacterium]|nr:hypothetical protein [Steroidobacteraceae bacterium]
MNARGGAIRDADMASPDRRHFMKMSGGLLIAFSFMDPLRAMAQPAAGNASAAPPDAARLDAWIAIHPDDTATLFTGKVDTG